MWGFCLCGGWRNFEVLMKLVKVLICCRLILGYLRSWECFHMIAHFSAQLDTQLEIALVFVRDISECKLLLGLLGKSSQGLGHFYCSENILVEFRGSLMSERFGLNLLITSCHIYWFWMRSFALKLQAVIACIRRHRSCCSRWINKFKSSQK